MKWLFLVHQVQTPNSRERVKVWRLTKKVGALLYRNSVYVLPYGKERLEDFHWLAQEIRDSKGEATVFVSEAGDEREDRILENLFRTARAKEYKDLESRVTRFAERCRQALKLNAPTLEQVRPLEKDLTQLEETLREIRKIDFFERSGARPIEKQLRSIRFSLLAVKPQGHTTSRIPHRSRSEFQGKTWTTRANIHIDRLSSAWLIKSFIDPRAKFVFAPEGKLPKNAIPFDVFGAEFSHQGNRCTFETLTEAFQLKDDALASIAELVHDIDLKDQKYKRAEADGLDMVVRALGAAFRDDPKTLALGSQILDALYQTLQGDPRKTSPRHRRTDSE